MGQVYVLISRVVDPQARGFVFFAPLGVWSFSPAKKTALARTSCSPVFRPRICGRTSPSSGFGRVSTWTTLGSELVASPTSGFMSRALGCYALASGNGSTGSAPFR